MVWIGKKDNGPHKSFYKLNLKEVNSSTDLEETGCWQHILFKNIIRN